MANTTVAMELLTKPGHSEAVRINIGVKASTKLLLGAAAVIASGVNVASKPSNTAGERFAGFVGDNVVDNSAGADSALRVNLLQPEFFQPNAWSVAPTAASVGSKYYWQDDQTLGLTPTVNYAGRLAYIDKNSVPYVRAAYWSSGSPSVVETITLQLADIAAGVFAKVVPYNFTLLSTLFRVLKAATTAAKAATLTPIIAATPVTGGVISLTSANMTPINNTVAGTAVTAANTGTAGQALGVTASAVTTFVEGDGVVEFTVRNDDAQS